MTESMECVICRKKVPGAQIKSHISGHVAYSPHRCYDCNFTCSDQNDLYKHEVRTGHKLGENANGNRYLDRLVSLIHRDCIVSEEHGYETIFRQSSGFIRYSAEVITTDETPLNVNRANMNNQNQDPIQTDAAVQLSDVEMLEEENEVEILQQPTHSRADCEKEMRRGQRSTLVSKTKTSTVSNKTQAAPVGVVSRNAQNAVLTAPADSSSVTPRQSARNDDIFMPQDEVANIARQMNRGPAVQKCNKCSQSVPNEYKSFKDHVLKFHLAECRSITDRDSFLSKYIQICFPFTIALNDFMCTLCGREFKSFSGRKSHVCNEHITVFLDCPRKIEGCTFSATTSEAVERHIKKDHPDGLSDVEQSAFLQKKKTFNNMIIPIIKRCFPCPIPQTERIEREELAAFQRMMAKDAQNQPVAARTQNELPKTRRPRARRSSSSDEEGAQLLNGSRSRTVPASIGAQVNANLQVNNTNQNNANNLDSLATEINIISANKSGTPTDGPPTSRISANALRNKSCERPYSTRTRNYSEMVEPQLRQSSNEDQRRTSNRPLPRRRSSPQRQVQPEHNSSSACNRRRSNNRSRSSVPSDDRRNERDRRRSPLKKHDHSPAKRTKPSPLASVPSTSTRITQRQSNNPRNSPNASSTFPSNLAQTAHSSMGQMTNPLPSHAGSSDHSRSGVSRFSNANVTGNFNTTLPYHKANPVMPSFTPLNPTTLPLMDFSVPPPPLPNNVFGSVSFNAFYPRGPADATYGNAPVGMMTKMEENRLNPQIFTSNVTTSHPNGLLPTSLTNTKNVSYYIIQS
ncbi:Zinc finger, C2H2 type family protein [Ditylenchus destructor]|uniref:Zinc finger, C2H2 type family protein n=1 Tax=Ditylenchus destructor TaxID=166010 RepID=A0AAD4R253_9BILA|nr:Zinc finger, C2H2 type family protein [Ditylenchus destructor]